MPHTDTPTIGAVLRVLPLIEHALAGQSAILHEEHLRARKLVGGDHLDNIELRSREARGLEHHRLVALTLMQHRHSLGLTLEDYSDCGRQTRFSFDGGTIILRSTNSAANVPTGSQVNPSALQSPSQGKTKQPYELLIHTSYSDGADKVTLHLNRLLPSDAVAKHRHPLHDQFLAQLDQQASSWPIEDLAEHPWRETLIIPTLESYLGDAPLTGSVPTGVPDAEGPTGAVHPYEDPDQTGQIDEA